MATSKERKFNFTWQIQNFSMCPQKFKEALKSPVFLVPMLENSEWQLVLYPKGDETDKYVSCYLRCISAGINAGGIQIGFTLSTSSDDWTERRLSTYQLLKMIGPGEVKCHKFKKENSFGYPSFISRDDIFWDENSYLPNDILTIKCSLWRSDDADSENDYCTSELKSEDPTDLIKPNVQDSGQYGECTVVTRVQVQRKNISWSIRNFSSIDFSERLVKHVPSSLENVPSFFITFKKSFSYRSAEFQIGKGPDSSEDTFVKCKISVLQTPKDVEIYAKDVHLFESDVEGIWEFPSFIKLNTLEEVKYFKRTRNVLHLRFDFSFSHPKGIHDEDKMFRHKNKNFVVLSDPIEEFRHLYEDGKPFDVTVQVGDQQFKAHKVILKARSPVIRSMFEKDMNEDEIRVFDISGFEPVTVDRMLTFMYTDAIGDMVAEDARQLYSAAVKYEVLSLKERCAFLLASCLSISNVCQVLKLSYKYNDGYLRECVESFIQANSVEIFKSQEWENLIEDNGTLAAKVMLKMLTN